MVKGNSFKNIFVDTSGWVALFIKDDKNNSVAAQIYKRVNELNYRLITSDYVFDETVTCLMQKLGHRDSCEAGEIILQTELAEVIPITPSFFETAWSEYKKYDDKKFSFTDVTSFCLMREMKISECFTFDHHFEQAGFLLSHQ